MTVVRIAVLVARTSDEQRTFAIECLCPIWLLSNEGNTVGIHDVVTGMATGAENDGIRADAERERRADDEGSDGCAGEQTRGISEVAEKVAEHQHRSYPPDRLRPS